MSILESPLNILNGCLLQVTLNMMRRMLRYVSDTQSGMLVHYTFLWDSLALYIPSAGGRPIKMIMYVL